MRIAYSIFIVVFHKYDRISDFDWIIHTVSLKFSIFSLVKILLMLSDDSFPAYSALLRNTLFIAGNRLFFAETDFPDTCLGP